MKDNEKMLFVLGQLQKEFGISMSDSIRKGVDLLFVAKRQEYRGRRLAFIDSDDNIVMEIQNV